MTDPNSPVASTATSPLDSLNKYGAPGPVYTGGAPSEEDKSTSGLMFYLAIILGFISPLIFFFTKKDRPFVQDQSKELLNFQIILLLAYIAVVILNIVLAIISVKLMIIGTLLMIVVLVINIILMVKAAGTAKTGVPARLPCPVRLIK